MKIVLYSNIICENYSCPPSTVVKIATYIQGHKTVMFNSKGVHVSYMES